MYPLVALLARFAVIVLDEPLGTFDPLQPLGVLGVVAVLLLTALTGCIWIATTPDGIGSSRTRWRSSASRVVRGKRTILETVRGVQTNTRTWHTLKVSLRDTSMSIELDGQEKLKRDVERAPEGRCGLWSKADSQVLFDDFSVGP